MIDQGKGKGLYGRGVEFHGVRFLRLLDYEVHLLVGALEDAVLDREPPVLDQTRQALLDLATMIKTAPVVQTAFPAGFMDWVQAQSESGVVDEIRRNFEQHGIVPAAVEQQTNEDQGEGR